ncbi:MAG: hypothetical protein Kow0074_24180 [Candidatus Zixiibacteriota bacterium]
MYYVLRCHGPDDADELMMFSYKRDHPRRSWASGRRFSDDPNDPPHRRRPPEPIRLEVKEGYENGVPLEFYDTPAPIMTKRLFEALRSGGVDNIDSYEVELVDPINDRVITDYVAFNLIGAVAAADLDKSVFDPLVPERMISMDFDSVTVSDDATHGALMFRLAQSVNAILVHQRIKDHIEASGIDTLMFIPPEEWAG